MASGAMGEQQQLDAKILFRRLFNPSGIDKAWFVDQFYNGGSKDKKEAVTALARILRVTPRKLRAKLEEPECGQHLVNHLKQHWKGRNSRKRHRAKNHAHHLKERLKGRGWARNDSITYHVGNETIVGSEAMREWDRRMFQPVESDDEEERIEIDLTEGGDSGSDRETPGPSGFQAFINHGRAAPSDKDGGDATPDANSGNAGPSRSASTSGSSGSSSGYASYSGDSGDGEAAPVAAEVNPPKDPLLDSSLRGVSRAGKRPCSASPSRAGSNTSPFGSGQSSGYASYGSGDTGASRLTGDEEAPTAGAANASLDSGSDGDGEDAPAAPVVFVPPEHLRPSIWKEGVHCKKAFDASGAPILEKGKQTYMCLMAGCGSKIAEKGEIPRHMRTSGHVDEGDPYYRCHYCPRNHNQTSNKEYHMKKCRNNPANK